jgi:hypothetical protein
MLTTTEKNTILDATYVTGDLLSAHTDFSATGANEVTGGSYARQPLTFAAASSGSKSATGAPVVSFAGLPAAVTIKWICHWNSTGTVLKNVIPNGGSALASFQVDMTNNRVICQNLSVANGDKVAFTGSTLPGGVTQGVTYFVVGATASDPNYFQVAATLGGAAIDLTAATISAGARVCKIVEETYSSAGGTHNVNSYALNI